MKQRNIFQSFETADNRRENVFITAGANNSELYDPTVVDGKRSITQTARNMIFITGAVASEQDTIIFNIINIYNFCLRQCGNDNDQF